MPTNFTQEERDVLTKKLFEKGIQLLKENGYKKMKVSLIAEAVGIGTGTFYHFFKSKDAYVIWLIQQRKKDAMNQFVQLALEYSDNIPMSALETYFNDMLTNYNIYRYLNQQEYDHLQKQYHLLQDREEKIEQQAHFMMSKLQTTKGVEAFKLFSEAYTILVIGTSDESKLNSAYTQDAIQALIHAACSILY